MTWFPHTTVAAVVERDGRFLMVEERDQRGAIVFNQPAGHLKEHETLLQAIAREVREETAWGFLASTLIGVYQWQVPPDGATYQRFCFAGACHDHRPDQPLDEGIPAARWMSRAELAGRSAQLRSPIVLACIDDYLAGHRYPLDLLKQA
ncbi:MAG: NUDIX hydrolase [gamma proteobacterium symbiont of Phacoides pectinatus]